MVARGYASLSFLSRPAGDIAERSTADLHLPSRRLRSVRRRRRREDQRNATRARTRRRDPLRADRGQRRTQIEAWDLPSRPTKTTDSRAKTFGHTESVELDAIQPNALRELVERAIVEHIDDRRTAGHRDGRGQRARNPKGVRSPAAGRRRIMTARCVACGDPAPTGWRACLGCHAWDDLAESLATSSVGLDERRLHRALAYLRGRRPAEFLVEAPSRKLTAPRRQA